MTIFSRRNSPRHAPQIEGHIARERVVLHDRRLSAGDRTADAFFRFVITGTKIVAGVALGLLICFCVGLIILVIRA